LPISIADEIRQLRALFWSDRDPEGRVFAPLADAYRRGGDLAQAVELLDEGLFRQADFAPGYVVSGWVRRDLGDDEAAALAFRTALTLDPENAEARQGLTTLARTAPEEAGATTPAAPGGPAAADDGPVTRTMADLYARQGLHARALAIYRQLLERDPEDATLRTRIAELAPLPPGARREVDVEKLARDWAEGPRDTGELSTPFAWTPTRGSRPQRSGPAAREYFRGLLTWEPGAEASAPPAAEPAAAAPVDEEVLEPPADTLDVAPEPVVAIAALAPDPVSVAQLAPHGTPVPIASLAPDAVPIASLAPDAVPIASLAPDQTGDDSSGWNRPLR
jgi:tetratricopeptide (TPR) repeat protein